MFKEDSFEVFDVVGLEARMTEIRAKIQPIFKEIGEKLLTELSSAFKEQEFYLHIAQHRRRTANAPENTWAAISTKPRGYKMEAHFQLGIWQDYVFVYLSIIDQPPLQKKYAAKLLSHEKELTALSADFVFSKNHTQAEIFPLTDLSASLKRLSTVKKSELEIGKVWERSKFDGQHDAFILNEMIETVRTLIPLYRLLMEE